MTKQQIFSDELLQSKVISFLRFPLIVMVVLIHTQINTINGIEWNFTTTDFDGQFPIYETTFFLFSRVIAQISVPLFFVISGFLFFYNIVKFSRTIYIEKLKKRFWSLLIPYLFWNIFFLITYNVCHKLFPTSTDSFIGEGYTLKDWLITLFGAKIPFSIQFWFIRDLMLLVILTPIIYWLTKKMNYRFVLLLGIIWFTEEILFGVNEFPLDVFFYFSLGSYLAIYKINFVKILKPLVKYLGVLYFGLIILIFYFNNTDYIGYINKLGIFVGIAFTISLSSKYIANGKWKVNKTLSESSFFIYAYHAIALQVIKHILFFIIPCSSDLRATILYFLWAAVTIIIGICIYIFIKKYLPKTTAFITGGR